MTPAEVLVDPVAEAKAKAIEAERRAAVERAWCSDHRFVDPATVHAVKTDDGYTINIDQVLYLCRIINPREIAVAKVDAQHALLEGWHPVAIPPIPVPAAPPSPFAVAVQSWKRCEEALDPFRRQVNLWQSHVRPDRLDPLTDLRGMYPGVSPSVFPGVPAVANTDSLKTLAVIIEQVASYARTLPAAERTHRQLLQETMTAITAGRASLVAPVLPSILTAGEPVQIAQPKEEQALDAAEAMVEKFREALTVLTPIITTLGAATPAYLKAGIQTLREGWCAIARLRIEIAVEDLQRLPTFEPERAASRAVQDLAQHLGQDLSVPEIQWGTNPWEPPKL